MLHKRISSPRTLKNHLQTYFSLQNSNETFLPIFSKVMSETEFTQLSDNKWPLNFWKPTFPQASSWAFFVPICVGKKEKKVFLLRQGTWISILIGSWQSWKKRQKGKRRLALLLSLKFNGFIRHYLVVVCFLKNWIFMLCSLERVFQTAVLLAAIKLAASWGCL